MASESQAPAVVLVRPTEEGNVGAAARAMANMGLGELVLVEPAAQLGHTAQAFAVGARHVLDGARRVDSLEAALAPFHRAVGTTSSRARALPGPFVAPRELPQALAADPPGTRTALVFGPERSGLTTDELAPLSPLVVIPTHPVQPTLNLAQAVLVVAYELFVTRLAGGDSTSAAERPQAPAEPAASVAEIEGLFDHLGRMLPAVGFARDDTADATVRDLRRFFSRAAPSSREVTILRGICRRVLGTVERLGGERPGGSGSNHRS